MNSFMKNLAVYLVLIVLAVIVAQYFMQQNPNIKKDFSYSDLISAVNEGRIKEITIIGNEEVQGTINNQRFVVPIPSEIVPELMEIIKMKSS